MAVNLALRTTSAMEAHSIVEQFWQDALLKAIDG